jgi:hypothetical protein
MKKLLIVTSFYRSHPRILKYIEKISEERLHENSFCITQGNMLKFDSIFDVIKNELESKDIKIVFIPCWSFSRNLNKHQQRIDRNAILDYFLSIGYDCEMLFVVEPIAEIFSLLVSHLVTTSSHTSQDLISILDFLTSDLILQEIKEEILYIKNAHANYPANSKLLFENSFLEMASSMCDILNIPYSKPEDQSSSLFQPSTMNTIFWKYLGSETFKNMTVQEKVEKLADISSIHKKYDIEKHNIFDPYTMNYNLDFYASQVKQLKSMLGINSEKDAELDTMEIRGVNGDLFNKIKYLKI